MFKQKKKLTKSVKKHIRQEKARLRRAALVGLDYKKEVAKLYNMYNV